MKQSGFTLIEVLVTFFVISIGLLGFIALQVNVMNNAVETYQRAQVINLLESMTARMRVNADAAYQGEYVDNSINLGKIPQVGCGNLATIAKRDLCEFNNELNSGNDYTKGNHAPAGSLGCIKEIPNTQSGRYRAFRIEIVWPGQGTGVTTIALDCGFDQIDEKYRRGLFRDVFIRGELDITEETV